LLLVYFDWKIRRVGSFPAGDGITAAEKGPRPRQAATNEKSIAVLPLWTVGARPEYFSDGTRNC
jgi:hypothetical protein